MPLFEVAFVKKYLTPKKKQLSSSLIALLSVAVITLVVWLVVLFLSVTEGIEKGWLDKLTSLNAPVRIKPSSEYFSSYYYNVDKYSVASHYLSKSLGQKARALISDPYDQEFDETLPPTVPKREVFANGSFCDPVKELTRGLEQLHLAYQDVEISGALLRLELLRQESNSLHPAEVKSQLTNVSYLASFPSKNPSLRTLLLPPSCGDLNHLLYMENREVNQDFHWLRYAHIQKLSTRSELWKMPLQLLPEKVAFSVKTYSRAGEVAHLLIPSEVHEQTEHTLERRGEQLFLKERGQPEIPLATEIPIFSFGKVDFSVERRLDDLQFLVRGTLQGKEIHGSVPFEGLEVTGATFDSSPAEELQEEFTQKGPIWPCFNRDGLGVLPERAQKSGILLAKSYRENGVRMGDVGYLAYSTPSISGARELHLPVYVAGFYDPGIMAVGNKWILVPSRITELINQTESPYSLERSESNNFFVWFPRLQDTQKIKQEILRMLENRGIAKYWVVETFHDYEFAKPLMQQFQSDRHLFTIVGVVILLVACTNIISLLVLLVSDKKREIGILRAMGAKRRSIAAIFACSGGALGLVSCLLGLLLAWITLHNLDGVVHLLSVLQGHDAFQPEFFGTSLPSAISPRAFWFAAIATPVLALISGLIPAIKAARLDPCNALRSE